MTDCIIPNRKIQYNGYTFTVYKNKSIGSHRAAWMEVNGPIPKGFVVDHTCHDPKVCADALTCVHRACINVEHLRLVTQQENVMAGRHSIDNRSHCNQGHPFIKENIMIRKNGWRECAECNRVRARAVWARKKVSL